MVDVIGSIPSLGAGLVFGSILTFGAYQASQNPPNFVVQLVSSATLAGVMGMRYHRSGKLMPAGIICIMSTAIMLRAGFRFASQYLEPAGLDKTAVTSR